MPSDGLTSVAPEYERLPGNFSCYCKIVTSCLWMYLPSIFEHNYMFKYPGFEASDVLFYTEDVMAESFSCPNRPHFMYDDVQLTMGSSQTKAHLVDIGGNNQLLNIRRAGCEGVKRCSAEGVQTWYITVNANWQMSCTHCLYLARCR